MRPQRYQALVERKFEGNAPRRAEDRGFVGKKRRTSRQPVCADGGLGLAEAMAFDDWVPPTDGSDAGMKEDCSQEEYGTWPAQRGALCTDENHGWLLLDRHPRLSSQ